MLKTAAIAIGLLVAAGASTAANATDYRYGYSGRDRVYRHYAPSWRHHPRHHYDRYNYYRSHDWRAHRHARYSRWWRRDY
jgi:hypothetical protein